MFYILYMSWCIYIVYIINNMGTKKYIKIYIFYGTKYILYQNICILWHVIILLYFVAHIYIWVHCGI